MAVVSTGRRTRPSHDGDQDPMSPACPSVPPPVHQLLALRRARLTGRWLRVAGPIALLAALAACATSGPQLTATQEAAVYQSHAKRDYTPPGPPGDPWGPYITEASDKYDVPDAWIRAVIGQESSGRLYHGGALVTSPVGAMGLMQLMPDTYDQMRAKYGMGDDAYDPHNNILAGTAYIREMYDVFGTPGFLAAYDAGPARLDDYFHRHRQLPTETRRYVARVGGEIAGVYPAARSDADLYAMNNLPIDTPDPRPPRRVLTAQAMRRERARAAVRYAYATRRSPTVHESGPRAVEEEVAMLPETGRRGHPAPGVHAASYAALGGSHRDWPHLIATASAAERLPHAGWGSTVAAVRHSAAGLHGRLYPARLVSPSPHAVCHHPHGKGVCSGARS